MSDKASNSDELRQNPAQPKIQPLICPYCGAQAELIDSAQLYNGKSFGWAWKCPSCIGVYVGCHRGTTAPLGTLANEQLRQARQRAHRAFDRTWQGSRQRSAAYRWLAEQLGIPDGSCHIAMMNLELCEKVCRLCKLPGNSK